MSDSDLNTSATKASSEVIFAGTFADKDVWVPVFVDNDRNEYVFLYLNAVAERPEDLNEFIMMSHLDMLFLGVRFVEMRKVEAGKPMKNVTCTAVSKITKKEYKVALVAGPVFEANYSDSVAVENDRIEYEARLKRGQEALDANAG